MNPVRLTSVLLGIICMTGCGDLLSLESIAGKDNTVFDPALLGTWTDNTDNDDALCVVKQWDKVDKNAYDIAWLNSGNSGDKVRLQGHLVQLGTERVLDVSGLDPGAFSVAAHVFLRVRLTPGSMELRFLDSDWLQNQVKRSSLGYSLFEGHPVLSARPAQVRTFLQEVGLKEEALDKPIQLTRLVPESSHH